MDIGSRAEHVRSTCARIHPPGRSRHTFLLGGAVGSCQISLLEELAAGVASQWTTVNDGLKVSVTTAGCEAHDVAMELLLCLGQALGERLSDRELRAYWMLLDDEISMGIEGEIDEQALEEKRGLLEKPSPAKQREAAQALWPCILRWDGGRVRSQTLA
jgi:hypothetical protein